MADEGFKRKLTAILSADVEGYSRLMGDDEEATVRTLTSYREVLSTLIQQNNGIVLDSPGDNLLAEFASVVDAVQCAVEVQKEIKARNDDLPENRRMQFRIGVNLGDVIQEEGSIYGDGVNIAARLESMADTGGICVSRTAYGQVKNKLELGYEYLGEHSVKNISEPVHVYKVLMEEEAVGKVIGEKKKTKRGMALAIALILLIGAGGLTGWYLYIQQSKRIEPALIEKMVYPLPDKPSIAVLPFDNLSGDEKQEYIADGITENIITALSKVPNVFVIARNSSFTYKGKPVKVQRVSEELGVRYVLEGSVQKSGDRIRINAQLIDAIKGHHLWAEKYDREFNDIFALQDDITLNILKELHVELMGGGRGIAHGTNNPEAYLKLTKGIYHFYRFNKEDNAIAREAFKEAIALDPDYPAAYHMVGETYWAEIWGLYSENVEEDFAKTKEMAQKTLALDDSYAGGHALMAVVYRISGQIDKAIARGKRAIELDPNGADIIAGQVEIYKIAGRPEEALSLIEKAMRLNPKPNAMYYYLLGSVYHMLGRYEEAIAAYEPIFSHESNYASYLGLVGVTFAYLELGQEAEAKKHAVEALKIKSEPLIRWAQALLLYQDVEYLKHLAKPLDSLQQVDTGKREVYVNEGAPHFKFECPADSVKEASDAPKTVLRLQSSTGLIIAEVWDFTDNMSLANFASKYLVQDIKDAKLGSNFKVISNKPILLKDGTEAYSSDLEFVNQNATYRVGWVNVSALRDKKVVSLSVYTMAGMQSEAAWISESLSFE